MAGNSIAVTPKGPKTSHTTAIITANTATDGTGSQALALTGDPTNGSRIDKITVTSLGTNAATSMNFFINDGLGTAAANNTLAHAITLASTTASNVAALVVTDLTITQGSNIVCPIPYLGPGQKLNVAIGTSGTTGWQVTVYYGDY